MVFNKGRYDFKILKAQMTQTIADVPLSQKSSQPYINQAGSLTLFPWKRADIILASITLNFFSLVVPILILQLYDRIIPNKSYSTLTLLAVGVLVAAILETLLRVSHGRLLSWLGMHFENLGFIGAFEHLSRTTEKSFRLRGIGEHVENIESIPILKEFLAGQGFLVLLDIPFLFFYLSIIGYFSLTIMLVPLTLLILFVVISWHLGRKLRLTLEEQLDVDDRRYNFIIEALSNHHTVKALGMEELLLRRYERLHAQCSTVTYKIYLLSSEFKDIAGTFSYIMFGAIVGIAALEVIHGNATVGIMAASILLANRTLQPVQAAMGMLTRLQHFQIAKERFRQVFKSPTDGSKKGISKIISGKIDLVNVNFSYSDNTQNILKDINLSISPGMIVTIYGKNGAGKSTLLNLLSGRLSPTEGSILIDDIPIDDYSSTVFRRQVIYLPPKDNLFQGTVIENMTLYQEGEIVNEALKLSHNLGLDDWIGRLPLGYNTRIGDSLFLGLPEGIQQRICLVRALVARPKILLLDESNTALDNRGDTQLKHLLTQLKEDMTIIFVTHRPSLMDISDLSFELCEGHLIQKSLPLEKEDSISESTTHLSSKGQQDTP
jgi:ATP-binding cassette subfamily C protein LapB